MITLPIVKMKEKIKAAGFTPVEPEPWEAEEGSLIYLLSLTEQYESICKGEAK